MGIILRIDIEKPFGNHTLLRKLLSKAVENYFPNALIPFGYLDHLKTLLRFLNKEKVIATLFHRLSNIPDAETRQLIFEGGHESGLHFENSRSRNTFESELLQFKAKMGNLPMLVSKHGSGHHKLGKYHYAPYEPEKYKKWAKELGVRFPSGNRIPENRNDLLQIDGYFEHVFWMEEDYRKGNFSRFEDFLDLAKKQDLVILIHPESFANSLNLRVEFVKLISMAEEKNIEWKQF
jgi:hypothetical protein